MNANFSIEFIASDGRELAFNRCLARVEAVGRNGIRMRDSTKGNIEDMRVRYRGGPSKTSAQHLLKSLLELAFSAPSLLSVDTPMKARVTTFGVTEIFWVLKFDVTRITGEQNTNEVMIECSVLLSMTPIEEAPSAMS